MERQYHGLRFARSYRTIDGRVFQGRIQQPSPWVRSGTFLTPRQVIRVDARSPVHPKDLIYVGSDLFLLAHQAEGQQIARDYKLYAMILADHQLAWTRRVTSIDPVSHLPRASAPTSMGLAYGSLEPLGSIDELGTDNPTYNFLTNADLQLNDTIGSYQVKRVDSFLGIVVAQVK